MKKILIKTKRIILREFILSDWRAVYEYGSNPDAIRYVTFGPDTKSDSQGFIGKAVVHQKERPRKEYDLAVILKTTGKLIGSGAIHFISEKSAEIGYILNPRFWRLGYGTEIGHALIEYGFNCLGLQRISATADPRNLGSLRILEKIGMRKEKYLKKYKYIKRENRWRDRILYGILRSDWEKSDSTL